MTTALRYRDASKWDRASSVCMAGTLLCFAVWLGEANAYQLSPEGTPEERALSGIKRSWARSAAVTSSNLYVRYFNEAVHEEVTNRIYGCEGGSDICGGMSPSRVPPGVLAGVRWNDDPPFMITPKAARLTTCKTTETIRFQTQPLCWGILFKDAKKRAGAGETFDAKSRSAMLYRTHFGDLQYLHAMASADGVPADTTQRQMLQWAEFTWSVATGATTIATKLRSIDIPTVQDSFGYTDWSVQDLLTLGSPGLREHIKDVAFGSLLHMVQDSFAEGHTRRESSDPERHCVIGEWRMEAPGVIGEFHAYNRQDADLHAEADSQAAFLRHLQEEADVVQVGQILRKAYASKKTWTDVAPFMSCIFQIAPGAAVASPGEQFQSQ